MKPSDWRQVPVFGQCPASEIATIRPSAYGLITNAEGRLAIVHTPQGVYLPGGGSDLDETPEDTVVREAREECGLAVHIGVLRRAAIEFVFSSAEQMHFEKRGIFCDAKLLGPTSNQAEHDHQLEWVVADAAAGCVTPASHQWAIREWLSAREPPPGVTSARRWTRS